MIAGIKGKDIREARDHEDSLTSAVFGHLRYLPPGVFWPKLFGKAVNAARDKQNLSDVLKERLKQCTKMEIVFWEYYEVIGEPDMILKFYDHKNQTLITIVVEVKFHSGESGNQLARYMKLVTNPPHGDKADYLIYLTPRESLYEINETISSHQCLENVRDRMFCLQWQDVLEVAEGEADPQVKDQFSYKTILDDVVTLLRKRGLEYFKGMEPLNSLEPFEIKPAPWIGSEESLSDVDKDHHFSGMNEINTLEYFTIEKGTWNQ